MHYFEKRNDTSSIVPKDNNVTFNHELHNDYLSKLLRKTIFNKNDKNHFKLCTTFIQTKSIH